jgi:hypothetical protein
MESYWCMKKNSITNWILYGIEFDVALVPCKKTECAGWRNGECTLSANRFLKDMEYLNRNIYCTT